MLKRVALYAGLIAAIALLALPRGGNVAEPGRILTALLLIPLFAWLIWLRWDWAPRARRKRREAEQAPPPDRAAP